MSGTLTDGLSGHALAGVLVNIDGLGETTTAADGSFSFAASGAQTERTVRMTSAATIERVTRLRVPGASTALTLIPSTIDLTAFNEMFRAHGGELHRWVTAPRLVIQRRVLEFTTVSAPTYAALAATLTDAEVAGLVSDFEWALSQLTDGQFTAFDGIDIETAGEGETVPVSRPGAILAARYDGLTGASGYWGYARWSWNGLGEVQQGILMLDRAFDSSGSVYLRSLRAHELGHTLGYTHVTARPSVMNSDARSEPTPADRDGVRLAFQRPPRNRAPDTDPELFLGNFRALASQVFWAGSH